MAPPDRDYKFGIEVEFFVKDPSDGRRKLSPGETRKFFANYLARDGQLLVACQCSYVPDSQNHKKCHPVDQTCDACKGTSRESRFVGGHAVAPSSLYSSRQNGRKRGIYEFYYVQDEVATASLSDPRWTKPVALPGQAPPRYPGPHVGLEVATPIFRKTELNSGLPALAKIMDAALVSGLKLRVNEHCGLHIHVGPENGMTLLQAKKLATLVALLEQGLFGELLPEARWKSEWAAPVSKASRLALEVSSLVASDHSATSSQLLQRVLAAGRMEREAADLGSKMSGLEPASHEASALRSEMDKTMLTTCPPEGVGVLNILSERKSRSKIDKHLPAVVTLIWKVRSLQAMDFALRRPVKTNTQRLGLAVCLREADDKKAKRLKENSDHIDYEDGPSSFEFRYPSMPQLEGALKYIRLWTELAHSIVNTADCNGNSYLAMINCMKDALEVTGKPVWEVLLAALGLGNRITDWRKVVATKDIV